ncbi:Gfo/Idh/MocA family protein [Paenibacillus sp. MBLB4367]|uniref:Gfo/Idh/MocA family protein n=1 Tax=Paenibacillus sp. MBLB4367 TaxID=3384767 RepID=UPI003907EACF
MLRLKLGLIGMAHPQASNCLEQLLERDDAEVVGIYDTCKERMTALQSRYGIRAYSACEQLLAADVDAVIVGSETKHHAMHVKTAASARKHVLCGEPLGLNQEEMREMLEACAANNVQLMTAFPYRYLPSVLEAKAVLESGRLGTVQTVKAASRAQRPAGCLLDASVSGGGAVMDQGVHALDLLSWLLHAEPVNVYAEAWSFIQEDAAILHVAFDNDVKAVLDTSWCLPESYPIRKEMTMEIIGTKGALTLNAFTQATRLYSDCNSKTVWSYWGDTGEHMLIHDFVRALLENKAVPLTGLDGFRATAAALAACESLASQAPCSLEPFIRGR